MTAGDLDALVTEILASAKYRHVSPDLVARIGAAELRKYPRLKDAVQATRSALHQAVGAYTDSKIPYNRILERLETAATSSESESILDRCRSAMQLHASTRERLPIVETFYQRLLGDIGPIQSVVDVACGLNPLASSYMPLAPGAAYHACDAITDLAEFLTSYFQMVGLTGSAHACDVVTSVPIVTAEVALVLKLLPILERTDPEAPMRLLQGLNAGIIIVSFPAQALGGRRKGMGENYRRGFREMVAGTGWKIEEVAFESEVCFRVRK